jgi:hypothetical protein
VYGYDHGFDDVQERVGGKLLSGDAWRRYMRVKESAPNARLIAVAGTTFRVESLERAMGKNASTATLVPEPHNPHDSNAVRVDVAGEHIGYVPKGTKISPHARPEVVKWGVAPAHAWLAVGA